MFFRLKIDGYVEADDGEDALRLLEMHIARFRENPEYTNKLITGGVGLWPVEGMTRRQADERGEEIGYQKPDPL